MYRIPLQLPTKPLAPAAPARRQVAEGPPRQVTVDGRAIEYRIKRSRQRRKTYQVSVVSGQVLLAVPYRTTNGEAEEMVRQKARWIFSKLDTVEARPEAPQFLSGESLPFRGRDLTLWVQGVDRTPSGRPEVSSDRHRLLVRIPLGLDSATRQDQVAAALVAWYGQQAREQVASQVARWLPALGNGSGPPVHIRNQRRRWGSCSSKGVLRFNWRLSMLEPHLVEYVVVHELCHLTHMNHSPDFWGLVARHLPDYKERRKLLKEREAALPPL